MLSRVSVYRYIASLSLMNAYVKDVSVPCTVDGVLVTKVGGYTYVNSVVTHRLQPPAFPNTSAYDVK